MARRTDFRAAKSYKGQKIKGDVVVSYKIDGVRLLSRDGKIVTRNDKVSPGLEIATTDLVRRMIHKYGDVELYKGSFFESNGPLQQHKPVANQFNSGHVYPLDIEGGKVDGRLFVKSYKDGELTPEVVAEHLRDAIELGYEGLVLRTDSHWYRVKPNSTADVRITGWFEQLDKNKRPKGQLGGFNTNYGKVTAFSEELRKQLFFNPEQYVGRLMQVTYKELYDTGSFRYCVTFNHFRDDKDEEAFDTRNLVDDKLSR